MRRSFQAINRKAQRANATATRIPWLIASRRKSWSGVSRVKFHGVSLKGRVCDR
ncbi:hypothetical protein D3C78_1705150 [compost metagenome]